MKGVIYEEIFKFIVKYWISYRDGSYECMRFETKQATGFTTPEDVKRELLCQFNWSNISTNITELNVFDHGDFTRTPMVTLHFEAQYRE